MDAMRPPIDDHVTVESGPKRDVLEVGAVIAGRYRLERKLGEGGMGIVWAAVHEVTRRTSALKFLKLTGSNPTVARRRFLQEARATSAIHHAGLLPIHDVLELDDGTLCMVMDLLRGESLRDKLAREGALPLAEVARIMARVCAAVGAAHAEGIVHRDLKPDNIFLAIDPDGTSTVKVLDFGIAKLTAESNDDVAAGASATGSIIGTPFYMAPEQLFAEPTLDHRADLWAIGVILYEALAGVRPTEAGSAGQIIKIVTQNGIVPLSDKLPLVPAPVADMVARLLQPERSDRPSDLVEVIAVLKLYTDADTPAFGPAKLGTSVGVASDEALAPTMDALSGALANTTAATAAAQAVERKPSASASTRIVAGVSALIVAACVFALAVRRPAHEATVSPISSGLASSTSSALPGPSRSPEATRLFEEAMRSYHTGTGQAVLLLESAVAADPAYGAAYLRLWWIVNASRLEGRERVDEYHRRLVALESTLSPRDHALFDALDGDRAAMYPRLDAYLAGFPDDDVAWMARLDDTMPTYERALRANPTLIPAIAAKARELGRQRRFEEAGAAATMCVERSPRAVDCLSARSFLLDQKGDCAGAEADARRWIELAPDSKSARKALAGSLAGESVPVSALREALGKEPPALSFGAQLPVVSIPMLEGDFVEVERIATDVLAKVPPTAPQVEHVIPVTTLIIAYTESGDLKGAGRVAADYLARSAAWKEPDVVFTGMVIGAAARGGFLDAAARASREEAAFQAYLKNGAPIDAWSVAYAAGVTTTAEAKVAIAKLDALGLGPSAAPKVLTSGFARTLFLAGRLREARPLLEQKVQSCSAALGNTSTWTEAHLYLGDIDAGSGDNAAACIHYTRVLERWGSAKPRSVIADEARGKSRTAGCLSPR